MTAAVSGTGDGGIITFADFQPGVLLGRHSAVIEPALLDDWASVFPATDLADDLAPPGLLSAMLMRAYLAVVTPRPPGNIHARQQFELIARPRVGASVTTAVRCLGKELRRERRRVELGWEMTDTAGASLMRGRGTILWAA